MIPLFAPDETVVLLEKNCGATREFVEEWREAGRSQACVVFVCNVNNADTQRFVYSSKSVCLLQSPAAAPSLCLGCLRVLQ